MFYTLKTRQNKKPSAKVQGVLFGKKSDWTMLNVWVSKYMEMKVFLEKLFLEEFLEFYIRKWLEKFTDINTIKILPRVMGIMSVNDGGGGCPKMIQSYSHPTCKVGNT